MIDRRYPLAIAESAAEEIYFQVRRPPVRCPDGLTRCALASGYSTCTVQSPAE